jgi:hypothetical protein
MFVSDQIVYLQMQKTGSSHVTKVLRKFTQGRQNVKHEQLVDYNSYKDRLIVSSVRNPWDWYVSLWAFGCGGSGGLHKYLTSLPASEVRHALKYRDPANLMQSFVRLASQIGRRPDWTALYADPTDAGNFRAWLKLLLGAEGQFISKEGYAASPVKSSIGLMTYRFLALATEYGAWNTAGRAARDPQAVAVFADRHTIASRILRMESLNADLLAVLQSVGIQVTLDDLDAISKTNTSTHRKYTDYYDDEAYRLVAQRDRLIIDRFGYQMF